MPSHIPSPRRNPLSKTEIFALSLWNKLPLILIKISLFFGFDIYE
jgi:hypothetical protein